jgi:hypothetical protein
MALFNREKIINLVKVFADELALQEIRGAIHIVGGAAVALSFNENRSTTTDIDATFPEDPRVLEIIKKIAEQDGLQPDWINSKAGNRIPFSSYGIPWHVHYKNKYVTVFIADADILFSMKLHANRGRRDIQDLPPLINALGISTLEAAAAIYDRFYSQELIPQEGRDFLEDYFQGRSIN